MQAHAHAHLRWKGYLKCKVVKSTSSFSGSSRDHERKLFMDEIKVMKRVSDGGNPHVLKMLGCVTTTNPMMLVLQFVPHGSLMNYLRAMRTGDDVRNNITIHLTPIQHAMHIHKATLYVARVRPLYAIIVGWTFQNPWW